MAETLDELLEKVRKLPPMTEEEKDLQAIDWIWGQLACSTNHKPRREVFKKMALARGWTEERFDKWADTKEWWC